MDETTRDERTTRPTSEASRRGFLGWLGTVGVAGVGVAANRVPTTNATAAPTLRGNGGAPMVARMLVADCPPERRDRESIAQFVDAEVIPVVEREEGFRGVYFFLDRESGRFFSITLYDTEEHLHAAQAGI